MSLNFISPVSKFGRVVSATFAASALAIVGTPAFAGSTDDSLNGFYFTVGPNIQHTKVDTNEVVLGQGATNYLNNLASPTNGTWNWAGGLLPANAGGPGRVPLGQTISAPSQSKTSTQPQIALGYMHPLWGDWLSVGAEGFYAFKTNTSNVASTTYGLSGLLAYNFVKSTQLYIKGSYVHMNTNLTGSQQFYQGSTPLFGPTGSNAFNQPGNPNYVDPDFKIHQKLKGAGVALGLRQLLPFSMFGSRHVFVGGEASYTKYSFNKIVDSPDYHGRRIRPNDATPFDGNIQSTTITGGVQYGANLYVGFRF